MIWLMCASVSVSVSVCGWVGWVCVWVCVCERERGRDRQRDRELFVSLCMFNSFVCTHKHILAHDMHYAYIHNHSDHALKISTQIHVHPQNRGGGDHVTH
jgi:hypothetical protein